MLAIRIDYLKEEYKTATKRQKKAKNDVDRFKCLQERASIKKEQVFLQRLLKFVNKIRYKVALEVEDYEKGEVPNGIKELKTLFDIITDGEETMTCFECGCEMYYSDVEVHPLINERIVCEDCFDEIMEEDESEEE